MSLAKLIKRMNELAKTNKMELATASSMLAVTADRIFNEGKAADNSSIGNYTKEYLRTRIKENYPASRKVILQATRQMANDFKVIVTGEDELGLGFTNQVNADKSEWVEDTYDKPIFKHTKDELKIMDSLLAKNTNKVING